jgi:hypothetical protein
MRAVYGARRFREVTTRLSVALGATSALRKKGVAARAIKFEPSAVTSGVQRQADILN